GIGPAAARAAFERLGGSLTAVRTPFGDAWILARDEPVLRASPGPTAAARLLPSGDTYFLLWGEGRELVLPDPAQRAELWTSRVWPGAVLVRGEIVGTWRRSQADVSIRVWRRLARLERVAVEAEARSLPVPGVEREIGVSWES